jgi:hypothetical protein
MKYELHTNSSFLGQLGVSAYCFDDSNRAYASIRVGLRKIRRFSSKQRMDSFDKLALQP